MSAVAAIDGVTYYASAPAFQISQSQSYVVPEIVISDVPPPLPQSIRIDSSQQVVEIGDTVQLSVLGTLNDSTEADLTPRATFTTYRTSSPAIATVGPDGLVTGVAPGVAFITALNDAATATYRVIVTRQITTLEICGLTQRADGSPIAGANVFSRFGGSATSGPDGRFMLTVTDLPSELESIEIYAVGADGSQSLSGGSGPIAVPTSGMLDAGVILLAPLCPERWASGFDLLGLDGPVAALTVYDDDGEGPNPPVLVAGGEFTTAGGQAANRIARWNPVTNSWSGFVTGAANGVSNIVRALTVYDDDGAGPNPPQLVAGGGFATAGGQAANYIARWNPVTNSWSSFGTGAANGMNEWVFALTVYDDDGNGPNPPMLVAGGTFTTAGGQTANRVARWNPVTNTWSSFGTGAADGVNNWVYFLTVYDDGGTGPDPPHLVAGGQFNSAGGHAANSIARWNAVTNSWSGFVSGETNGMGGSVGALTVYDDDGNGPNPPMLVAGGTFTTAGGQTANRIAGWNPVTNTWSSFGTGAADGVGGASFPYVNALTVYDDDGSGPNPQMLVAGGNFGSAGVQAASRIARWNPLTNQWCSFGTGNANGVNRTVMALTVYDDDGPGSDPLALPRLFVGGNFTSAGGIPSSFIAEWSRPTSCLPGAPGAPGLFDPEGFPEMLVATNTFDLGVTQAGLDAATIEAPSSDTQLHADHGSFMSSRGLAFSDGDGSSPAADTPATSTIEDPAEHALPPTAARLHITTPLQAQAATARAEPNTVVDAAPLVANPAALASVAPLIPPGSPWRLVNVAPVPDQPGVYDADALFNDEPRRVRLRQLAPGEPCCDLDNDGVVGFSDLVQTLSAFTSDTPGAPDTDLNLDGVTDLADTLIVLEGWSMHATKPSEEPSARDATATQTSEPLTTPAP